MSQPGKFQTGFSDSYLTAEELRAKLYSDVGLLGRMLPKDGRRFRFKLEVHEV